MVFKYKAKTRYRRKLSHRQGYTRLMIQDIQVEQPKAKRARKPSKPRAKKTEPKTEGQDNGA